LKAFVLAGGKGTRLRPLTYTKPKPLLPLAGEAAIAYLIRKLAHEGIDEIILTTNYFASRLHADVGDGSKYGLRIHHVEEKIPLGTAGSVKNSESLIDGTFLVVQGDNQFEFDPKEVIQLHRNLNASATLALVEVENPSEYGIVELSDGRITRFLEKPKPEECFSNLINTGFYVLEPEVLKLIPKARAFDFSRDLFPLMIRSKMTLAGFRAKGFWIDIGDPESYLRANVWAFDKLEPQRAAGERKIVCGLGISLSEKATVTGPAYLGDRVQIHEDTVIGPYCYVGEGSEVSAGARITSSIVYEGTSIGANAVLDTCVVAENCKIGHRVQIERNAVVGAGTELGDNSHVASESKIGPWAVIETSAVVNRPVTASENSLEKISDLLQKPDASLGLTREGGRVCSVLLELGKADAQTIAKGAHIPISKMDALLLELENRGMITSLAHMPRIYALASLCNE
jgi:mannose-1-phosphate guanylyltransferase/phosphomannomutase